MTAHEERLAATAYAAAVRKLEGELDGNPLEDIGHLSHLSGAVPSAGFHWDHSGAVDTIMGDVAASPDTAANDWPRKNA